MIGWRFFAMVAVSATCGSALGAEEGLAAFYDFEEGAGAVAHDRSGNGHDAKLVGPRWVTVEDHQALKFDGTDDYVDCGPADAFKFKGSFSLALWVRHESVLGWQDYVGNYIGGRSGIVIAQNSGHLYFHNGGVDPYTLDLLTLKMRDGVWHHVAAVFDQDNLTMKIHLDGLEAASQEVKGTPTPSASRNLIMGRYEDGREPFNGVLDDVRIYNRPLSEAEIMAQYSADPRSQKKESATAVKAAEQPPVEDSDVLMGMRLEEVVEQGNGIRVTATGSVFSMGKDGSIGCAQRIPLDREVARIALPPAVLPLKLTAKNDFACALAGEGITLRLQGDSLLIIKADRNTRVNVTGLFTPSYHAHRNGNRLFIDERGGFGLYPTVPEQVKSKAPALKRPRWRVDYPIKKGEELWVSVFPPRPYNWKRSFQSLAHEGWRKPLEKYAYPDNEIIKDTARFCDIFAVHSYIWPGGDRAPWLIPKFVASDAEKFKRMRDAVKQSGMKLVLYLSPYYYRGEDLFAELRGLLAEDKTDGFYFDGVSGDFRKSYRFVRHSRRILGDERILYTHCSTDPLGSANIYCPFIDTYSDYILRGEAGRGGRSREDFLRWICSGYNISNTVGIWCYYGSTGASGYVHKVPSPEDVDAALKNHARIWRTRMSWEVVGGGNVSDFDNVYYPALEKLRAKIRGKSPGGGR